MLDNELTMRPHINKISSACLYHLWRLQLLHRLVDRTMMQNIVSAFVISRLDYCNSILAGLPACVLELLKNNLHTMVRLVAGLGPRDHVRESMKDLHWLPIAHRIKFKLYILMHGAIFGQSLSYIRDLFVPVSEMQDRTHLHSAAGLYDVPFTRTHFGRRAFSVAAPLEWNSLPDNIRQIPGIRQFKRLLKTHYFTEAYS